MGASRVRTVCGVVCGMLAVLAAGAARADETPEDVLRGKGLTRADGRFVLADEEGEALRTFAEVDASFTELARVAGEMNAILRADDQLAELRIRRQKIFTHMRMLKIQIDGFPRRKNSIQRAVYNEWLQAREQVTKLDDTIADLGRTIVRPQARKQLAAEWERIRSTCAAELDGLKYAMDPVADKYKQLDKDPEVKEALLEVSRTTRVAYRLGPSDAFREATRRVEQASRDTNPPARRRGR